LILFLRLLLGSDSCQGDSGGPLIGMTHISTQQATKPNSFSAISSVHFTVYRILNNDVLYCFLRVKVLKVDARPDANPNLKLVLLNGVPWSGTATQYGGGRDANRRYAWIGIVSFGVGCAEVRMCCSEVRMCCAEVRMCCAEVRMYCAEVRMCCAEVRMCCAEVRMCCAEVRMYCAEVRICAVPRCVCAVLRCVCAVLRCVCAVLKCVCAALRCVCAVLRCVCAVLTYVCAVLRCVYACKRRCICALPTVPFNIEFVGTYLMTANEVVYSPHRIFPSCPLVTKIYLKKT
jgi:hypothetical protein